MMRGLTKLVAKTVLLASLQPLVWAGCIEGGAAQGMDAQHDLEDFSIIPLPRALQPGHGEFRLDPETRIVLSEPDDEAMQHLATSWAEGLRGATGLEIPISTEPLGTSADNAISLHLLDEESANGEAYQLHVTSAAVTVSASAPVGLFYGLQTVLQMLRRSEQPGDDPSWSILSVDIVDSPRFSYRGMHLDVGRHLFPVAFIKKYLDLMARYKMNTFHWHLTEDQGWRIEIKKYPLLTEIGAYRDETLVGHSRDVPREFDGQPYGGFYSQDEVREIVKYAQERFITVIPEIEMPGHATAALAAYPEYSCTGGPIEVATSWGVFEDIFCPSEETFSFIEDVLTEVMDLFPGTYVHIGGDEVPKTRWEESELAQSVMAREGLADEAALQSYFVQRIETFLLSRGRRLIGWDEILEGGLAAQATVMSWRGMEGGIAAARQGHDVVMTPRSHCYFDSYQASPEEEPLAIGGLTPLDKVYGFEPIPDDLSTEQAAHILGAQGNVWTEYIKSPEHVEYMAVPRMLALAEVLWSSKESRLWDDFSRRLAFHFELLDALEVNYRHP